MPQKRNPVALEHARAIGSKALGQTSAILLSVHNTPFGDIVDTEDDLQPLVAQTFKDAARAAALVAAAMTNAEFDVSALAARAEQGWITATELADTLAREQGLPFKTAHAAAAAFVAEARTSPDAPLAAVLRRASSSVTGREVVYSDAALAGILSPRHFVEIRTTLGGPAPAETLRALEASRSALEQDGAWLDAVRAKLRAAEQQLKDATVGL
ncbi:MAG: argininosuccinate lyase, partial [Vicinamibacterales bacterium]